MSENHDSSPMWPVFESVQVWVRRTYGRHRHVTRLRLILDNGEAISLPVPLEWAGRDEPDVGSKVPRPPEPPVNPLPPYRHSPDFRCVNWFGEVYGFTESQASVVRLLWENWERGTPDVSDKLLLRSAESEATCLADVFRDNAAWGTLIKTGLTRGVHRLASPSGETSP